MLKSFSRFLPQLLWSALAILFVIGILLLHPIYVEVQATPRDQQQYEMKNALEIIFSYSISILTSAAFWTAVATLAIAYFTGRLISTTRRQADIADRQASIAASQAEVARLSERAYVRMSHTPPGINPANRKVEVEIKNVGRTPADVMGVRLGPIVVEKGDTLPPDPPYKEKTEELPGTQAFLPSGDYFFARRGMPISDDDWKQISEKKKYLYIFGLVEYVDRFGNWHRAGYARRYAPGRENNLAFVGLSGTYTYDVEINSSERLTSDEPAPKKE